MLIVRTGIEWFSTTRKILDICGMGHWIFVGFSEIVLNQICASWTYFTIILYDLTCFKTFSLLYLSERRIGKRRKGYRKSRGKYKGYDRTKMNTRQSALTYGVPMTTLYDKIVKEQNSLRTWHLISFIGWSMYDNCVFDFECYNSILGYKYLFELAASITTFFLYCTKNVYN